MVDRDDIDALLIGSLYGELSSADEARLVAHLESHPSDRTALADLTRAREAVRESRILAVQLEPPQSISALLMQEAARRAPKQDHDGWFQRFLRSFMAHPAMAAAVMLVVVVGVAGTMYMRQGDQFADQTKSVEAPAPAQHEMMAGARAPEGAPATASPAAEDSIAQGQAAGSATYGVTLGDSFYRQQAGADRTDGENAKLAKQQDRASETSKLEAKVVTRNEAPARVGSSERVAKRPKRRGIMVTTPQHGPKDMDESAFKEGGKAPAAKPADPRSFELDSTVTTGRFSRAPAPPPAPGAGAAIAPAEPSPRPATKRPARPRPEPELEFDANAERRTLTDKTVRRDQQPPARASERKLKNERQDSELAWARNQHARVSAQVRAGKCQNAASLAVAISNRAPGYYQQNVASDRDLKKCMTYIVAEREREAERVQQRARAKRRSADEPAKAAPPAATSKE